MEDKIDTKKGVLGKNLADLSREVHLAEYQIRSLNDNVKALSFVVKELVNVVKGRTGKNSVSELIGIKESQHPQLLPTKALTKKYIID